MLQILNGGCSGAFLMGCREFPCMVSKMVLVQVELKGSLILEFSCF